MKSSSKFAKNQIRTSTVKRVQKVTYPNIAPDSALLDNKAIYTTTLKIGVTKKRSRQQAYWNFGIYLL